MTVQEWVRATKVNAYKWQCHIAAGGTGAGLDMSVQHICININCSLCPYNIGSSEEVICKFDRTHKASFRDWNDNILAHWNKVAISSKLELI